MKLTVFQFEGTPEELDASELLQKLTGQSHSAVSVVVDADQNITPSARIPGVAEEGQETVRDLLARSPAPELFVRFLEETTRWDNVVVHGIKRKNAQSGAPLDYGRYLRLRKQGSQFGGFAYVYPECSSINLRLNYTDERLKSLGITNARTLHTGHPEYRVSFDLTGGEPSLTDALRLAELAYNAT
ncbi:hypothetical protein BJY54_006985 [Streptomyces nodosus]|uniref:hypothetical protein n=1 Tax=Streptomyces nodosus TaxID=40318 RepID=UPI00161F4119|nr:hypothetical protein [Streptomyces nodosus]MBB4796281.1 hypothetical protein [Streptomyces nodosus]